MTTLNGFAGSLEVSSPVRAGTESTTVTFTGQSGDLAFLFYSQQGQIPGVYLPIAKGEIVINPQAPLVGALRGQLDSTGTLVLVDRIAPLPPGVSVQSLTIQGLLVDANSGGLTLTGPSLLVLLDPSI